VEKRRTREAILLQAPQGSAGLVEIGEEGEQEGGGHEIGGSPPGGHQAPTLPGKSIRWTYRAASLSRRATHRWGRGRRSESVIRGASDSCIEGRRSQAKRSTAVLRAPATAAARPRHKRRLVEPPSAAAGSSPRGGSSGGADVRLTLPDWRCGGLPLDVKVGRSALAAPPRRFLSVERSPANAVNARGDCRCSP
jgi:hypothetical protein